MLLLVEDRCRMVELLSQSFCCFEPDRQRLFITFCKLAARTPNTEVPKKLKTDGPSDEAAQQQRKDEAYRAYSEGR